MSKIESYALTGINEIGTPPRLEIGFVSEKGSVEDIANKSWGSTVTVKKRGTSTLLCGEELCPFFQDLRSGRCLCRLDGLSILLYKGHTFHRFRSDLCKKRIGSPTRIFDLLEL